MRARRHLQRAQELLGFGAVEGEDGSTKMQELPEQSEIEEIKQKLKDNHALTEEDLMGCLQSSEDTPNKGEGHVTRRMDTNKIKDLLRHKGIHRCFYADGFDSSVSEIRRLCDQYGRLTKEQIWLEFANKLRPGPLKLKMRQKG